MPPKRPIKPALQQQPLQQADQQSQVPLSSHPDHGNPVVQYGGHTHGGGNVGGINVGFHQPSHHLHSHHPLSGVIGADGQLVLEPPNSGNGGKLIPQNPMETGGEMQNAGAQQQPPQQQQQQQQQQPGTIHRKRSRVSKNAANAAAAAAAASSSAPGSTGGNGGGDVEGVMSPPNKRSRTNTPWTPQEEQRLKAMRDAGNSWSEIAKTFPTRTEGSVKKHWYKVLW